MLLGVQFCSSKAWSQTGRYRHSLFRASVSIHFNVLMQMMVIGLSVFGGTEAAKAKWKAPVRENLAEEQIWR